MHLRPRTILPALLVAAGIALLVGCFYLPIGSPKLDQSAAGTGKDIVIVDPDQVPTGKKDDPSLHHFRTGLSTRDDVLTTLHASPAFATPDGRSLLYSQTGRNGYWVFPLCFYAGPDTNGYYVRLNFDAHGTLISASTDQRPDYQIQEDPSLESYAGVTDAAQKAWLAQHPIPWPPPLGASPSTKQSTKAP